MTDLHDLLEHEAARIDEELTHYDAAAEDAFVRKFAERVATEQADQRRASPARAVGHRSSGPQGAAGPTPLTTAPTARTTPGRTETPLSSAACRAQLRLQPHHLCRSITAAGSGKVLKGDRALEIGCVFYTRDSEAMAERWWRAAADGGDESAPHLLAVLLTTICRTDNAAQLHIDPHHVWAGTADDDTIRLAADLTLGWDPTNGNFGGQTLKIDTSGHSGYWDPHSESLANQGKIIAGRTPSTIDNHKGDSDAINYVVPGL
ncbi:hypothetical protein [Kitasatospora sp. NPDC004272]